MRYSLALVLGALALSACADQMDRSPTSPFSPRFSFTALDPTAKAAFEGTIRDGIRCLVVDPKQETRKLSDFDLIVEKANKGEVQSVTDWVNNFVKWADDYGTSKKTDPPVPADCGGRSLTYAQAAQELYNLLYWYSGQYAKISSVDYGSEVDAAVVTCFPNMPCELDGENAFIRAPAGTFNFPVILGFRPLDGPLPEDFNEVGTPVPPFYEFFTIPDGVIANGDGWGRYICVSHVDFHTGDNNLYKLTNGLLELVPDDATQIFCEPPEVNFSNPFLRRLHQFASKVTAPVRPRTLYATGHRAIGGPSTAASPHAVVRAVAVSSPSCDVVTDWGDANTQSWDITSNPYPNFTSFASLTVYLRMDAAPSAQTVSARARRFTANETGGKDLGFASSVAYEASGDDYKVTFAWPSQPVQPGGRVDVDIAGLNSTSVDYGVTTATGCVLREFGGSQRPVAGSIAGHPQGGNEID